MYFTQNNNHILHIHILIYIYIYITMEQIYI
jgi:hypothetical protein